MKLPVPVKTLDLNDTESFMRIAQHSEFSVIFAKLLA